MKLQPGMLIRTNYSGPYRIVDVERGCTCPRYLDELDMDDPPPQVPHIHITCTRPNGKGRYWLNNWDEKTLLSLDKTYCGGKKRRAPDRIIVLGQLQMDLPLG